MPSNTTHYNWVKPDVAGSADVWGGNLNSNLDQLDATLWSVQASVPVVAAVLPLADGVAAIGSSAAFARADHVHPITLPQAIGDNRIINGNFAINQRGQISGNVLGAAVYGHDRWKAGASGCTYTFTVALPDTTITITAGTLTQIIEAGMIEGGVYTLSWTGTVQARIYQGTPTGVYAASPIVTPSLLVGVNTIVEFNAGTLVCVKLEIGSVATPFNRQSLAKSMADCQRYYGVSQVGVVGYASVGGGTNVGSYGYLPVSMRATPTINLTTIGTDTNVAIGNVPDEITVNSFRVSFGATAAGLVVASRSVIAIAEL